MLITNVLDKGSTKLSFLNKVLLESQGEPSSP